MYPRSISKSLNYKFRELELIIRQLDPDNHPSRIDAELALDKARELYDILLKINSGLQEEEKNEGKTLSDKKPVVASDPDPVDDDEVSNAEGITSSPMYRKTEKQVTGEAREKEIPEQKQDQKQESKQDKSMEKMQGQEEEKSGPDQGKVSRKEKTGPDDESNQISGKKKESPKNKDDKPHPQDIEIVADRYQSSQNFINQAIANKQTKTDLTTKLQSKPIKDLRNSIGMNEKFLFIKELFKGRPEKYNQCIDDLNQSASYQEAISYIRNNYSWEEDNDVVEKFINLVKRKHQAE